MRPDEEPEMSITELLLWCRDQGFRPREVTVGGVHLVLDDLRPKLPHEVAAPGPRTIHEAWAEKLGVKMPPDPDEPEDLL